MDSGSFDGLTRALTASLSGSTTRRGVTRLLGGLALGGPLVLVGLAEVAAKCKKTCGPCKRCKKGKCKPKPAGTVCAGGTCQGGSCVTAAANVPSSPLACGAGGPCIVFLSSTLHGGNLKGRSVSGLAGAEAICQRLANDANLPGTYKAWLSDSFNSPTSRFVPSSGPYQLVDGTTIAANFTDLTDGTLLAPIDVTETGVGIGAADGVWTHTLIDGTPGGAFGDLNCENWSTSAATAAAGNFGFATSNDQAWTDGGSSACNVPSHLYCFQQS